MKLLLLLLLVAAAVGVLAQNETATVTQTAQSAAPSDEESPYGGVALRWPNSTCPEGSKAMGESSQTICCPDSTVEASGGYCCPSSASCHTNPAPGEGQIQACANTTWTYYPVNTTNAQNGFCCLSTWIGIVDPEGVGPTASNGDGYDGVGCGPPGYAATGDQQILNANIPVTFAAQGGFSETTIAISTSTSTSPASTSATTTSSASTTSNASASATATGSSAQPVQNSSSSSTPVGAIVGAVVAVVAIVGVVIIAVFWIRHRRSKRQHAGAIDPLREIDARDAPDAGKPMMQTDVEEKGHADSAGESWPTDRKDNPPDYKRMSELGIPDSPRELVGGEIHELPADFHGFEMPPAAMDEPLEGSSRVVPPPATIPMSQTALENLLIDLDIPQSLRIGHRGSAYVPPVEAVPEESQDAVPQAKFTVAKSEELEKHDGPAETEADKNLSPPLEGAFPDRTGAVSPLMGVRGENRDSEIRAVSPTPEDNHADATGAAADAEVHEERAPVSPQLEAQTEDEPQGQVATEVRRLERIATASDAELRR